MGTRKAFTAHLIKYPGALPMTEHIAKSCAGLRPSQGGNTVDGLTNCCGNTGIRHPGLVWWRVITGVKLVLHGAFDGAGVAFMQPVDTLNT